VTNDKTNTKSKSKSNSERVMGHKAKLIALNHIKLRKKFKIDEPGIFYFDEELTEKDLKSFLIRN
jgi:hypothetical protein